ncbi:hypothetical protein V6N13_025028 [Hibiscus sabdariffa]
MFRTLKCRGLRVSKNFRYWIIVPVASYRLSATYDEDKAWCFIHLYAFDIGFHLLILPFFVQWFNWFNVALDQLSRIDWGVLITCFFNCKLHEEESSVKLFCHFYQVVTKSDKIVKVL